LAEVKARLSCRDEIGLILGVPPLGRLLCNRLPGSGKQPSFWTRLLPIRAPQAQQPGRQHHFAVFAALSLIDMDQHPIAVVVSKTRLWISLILRLQTSFGLKPSTGRFAAFRGPALTPQTSAIRDTERGPVLQPRSRRRHQVAINRSDTS
jgi:hypothetical protein